MSDEPEAAKPSPGRDEWPCTCDGSGWKRVLQPYADRHAPLPERGTVPDADWWKAKSRNAAFADSWYPCKGCNTVMFHRWQGGHLASDHNRVGCAECRSAVPSRSAKGRRGRRVANTPPLPIRVDID